MPLLPVEPRYRLRIGMETQINLPLALALQYRDGIRGNGRDLEYPVRLPF